MEEQLLGITKFVNLLLGKPALALLAALHIQPANREYPIPNHVAMEFVVFLIAIVFFLWLKARLSVENPGATQRHRFFGGWRGQTRHKADQVTEKNK
jgi:hypothetical protein